MMRVEMRHIDYDAYEDVYRIGCESTEEPEARGWNDLVAFVENLIDYVRAEYPYSEFDVSSEIPDGITIVDKPSGMLQWVCVIRDGVPTEIYYERED